MTYNVRLATICPSCEKRTYFDPVLIGKRAVIDEDEENLDSDNPSIPILCPTCCKAQEWKSKLCLKCSEFDICSNSWNDTFKNWLEGIKGV